MAQLPSHRFPRRCLGVAAALALFLVCRNMLLQDGGRRIHQFELPDPLISNSLGALSLSTDTIEAGDRTLRFVTYGTEIQVPRHDTVALLFYADLTWPYGADTNRQLETQVPRFEQLVSELIEMSPEHLLETIAPAIQKYGEDYQIASSTAESTRWRLESVTLMYANERCGLIFNDNNAYPGYKLVVDFDFTWTMRSLMFDGSSQIN